MNANLSPLHSSFISFTIKKKKGLREIEILKENEEEIVDESESKEEHGKLPQTT
jgi:hypothetical protein